MSAIIPVKSKLIIAGSSGTSSCGTNDAKT